MAHGDLWSTMEALRREIDRAFEQFGWRSAPMFQTAFLPGQAARRYPLINLHEDRDTFYVEALAPGIDPASLELSVVGNMLTISGEKQPHPAEIKPEAFHRSERAAGRFIRLVELPLEVDKDNVQAEYRHGLLCMTLPKAAWAKPKHIALQAA